MSPQVHDRPRVDAAEEAPTTAVHRRLTTFDRCDAASVTEVDGKKVRGACGAQAFVRVVLPSGNDLLFCGHHIDECHGGKQAATEALALDHPRSRREALERMGAQFFSDYDRINLKPTDPSGVQGF